MGDNRPLVANVFVHIVKKLLFLGGPFGADDGGVEVIVIPTLAESYL